LFAPVRRTAGLGFGKNNVLKEIVIMATEQFNENEEKEMQHITAVEVYLDTMSETMLGVIRVANVVAIDDIGNEEEHDELIDNKEYDSEDECVADIAKRLSVDPAIAEIVW
jgi:ornithine cyclodeaminase/alanine dehydrogenase-like protein (mu-crystallin family)